MPAAVLLDPARLDRPDTMVQQQPFPFMVAHGQLPDEARSELVRDFPDYTSAGFFPYDPGDCGPSVNALI
ncbi:MAG TPA: 2OG-Fe(II) oxygenase, partial [Rhodanobacter sp.]|nr:2OG-Fe(II) oxygenase [Rhodanobacter sp.]